MCEYSSALHELVAFKGLETSSSLSPQQQMLPLVVRKMIAREVELENIRRTEGMESNSGSNSRKASPFRSFSSQGNQTKERNVFETPKKSTALKPRIPWTGGFEFCFFFFL